MKARTQSQRTLAEGLADQIEGISDITVHRYFAGAGLRANGVQFGFVMKGILYFRVDEFSRETFEARQCAPFSYRGASGVVTVGAYYEVPNEILDDPECLSTWAADALRAARSTQKRSALRHETDPI